MNKQEFKTMQNDNSFTPHKQWEQTSTGYYIVPIDMLDVKGAPKDNDGKRRKCERLMDVARFGEGEHGSG